MLSDTGTFLLIFAASVSESSINCFSSLVSGDCPAKRPHCPPAACDVVVVHDPAVEVVEVFLCQVRQCSHRFQLLSLEPMIVNTRCGDSKQLLNVFCLLIGSAVPRMSFHVLPCRRTTRCLRAILDGTSQLFHSCLRRSVIRTFFRCSSTTVFVLFTFTSSASQVNLIKKRRRFSSICFTWLPDRTSSLPC